MSDNDTFPVYVLGRRIGVAGDFYDLDSTCDSFVAFVPDKGVDLPACDLTVEYMSGEFRIYNENGDVSWRKDIIDSVAALPKAKFNDEGEFIDP